MVLEFANSILDLAENFRLQYSIFKATFKFCIAEM